MDRQLACDKLYTWGYLQNPLPTDAELEAAVHQFKKFYGNDYEERVRRGLNRTPAYSGDIGPVTETLISERTCDVPDFVNGQPIAEARWPASCATGLEVSFKSPLAGLSESANLDHWRFNAAQWNTAFVSPLDGKVFAELMAEYRRLNGSSLSLWVLPVGTITHEVGHALGLPHTPSDPNSVMYPSMRGQWLLNRTDVNNLKARGYSATDTVKLRIVAWNNGNTHVWATNGPLPGSTLAWSMLANGSCSQRAEQRYDTTVRWNSGQTITLPDTTPPPPVPSPPPGTKVVEVEWRDPVILQGESHVQEIGRLRTWLRLK